MVRVLRSAAAKKVGVQRFNAFNWSGQRHELAQRRPTELTAAPTQVGTLVRSDTRGVHAGRGAHRSEIRISTATAPSSTACRSLDDGKSWGAPALVYDGGLNYGRFSNIASAGSARPGSVSATATTPRGMPVVLGLHDGGAGWVPWPAHPASYGHWQVAGVRPGPEAAPNCRVYAYLWGTEYDAAGTPWNSLACQQIQVTSSGAFTAWGTRAVVDRAGVEGAAAYDRVRFGEGGGAYLFALQERAATGYWFVAALYALPGNADMEEPVYLAEADGANGGPANCETLHAAGRRPPRLAGGRRAGVGLGAERRGPRRGRAHLHADLLPLRRGRIRRRRDLAADWSARSRRPP